jgi:hypothetical protein
LHPLTLPNRIPRERYIAVFGERHEQLLPDRVRFCSLLVSQREQNRRVWTATGFREIQVRSHIKPRLALKDDFFDPVPFMLDDAGHAWVQGRTLRHLAKRTQHSLPNMLFPRRNVACAPLSHLSFAGIQKSDCAPLRIVCEHTPDVPVVRMAGEKVQTGRILSYRRSQAEQHQTDETHK